MVHFPLSGTGCFLQISLTMRIVIIAHFYENTCKVYAE